MLVDVVAMRAAGVKLPAAQVKAAAPVRGRLSIETKPWRETWQPHLQPTDTTFAHLHDPLEDDPLEPQVLAPLREARVTRMVGDTFVIVGLERHGIDDLRAKDLPQAWLCRVVR